MLIPVYQVRLEELKLKASGARKGEGEVGEESVRGPAFQVNSGHLKYMMPGEVGWSFRSIKCKGGLRVSDCVRGPYVPGACCCSMATVFHFHLL